MIGAVTEIIAGVDTHKDTHTAAALDIDGKLLGVEQFPTSENGYAKLLRWVRNWGTLRCIAVEGTGSYGSGLTRYLRSADVEVLEAPRPSRQLRRRRGKSDPVDAEAAARAILSGQTLGTPKSQDGPVECLRLLRSERRSAIKARTQAANQIHATVVSAPERVRTRVKDSTLRALIDVAAKFRVASPGDSLEDTARYVLRNLAKRWLQLNAEVRELDKCLARIVRKVAPEMIERRGIGIEVASALLVAVGDNPERMRNEASFAALCGVSPVDASSGRQRRHRLNRGGNRDANRALWVIAFVRLRSDERTKAYVEKRTAKGLSKMEVIRCLKRYIAREVFGLLTVARARLDT